MKFTLKYVSDWEKKRNKTIELQTLEDLLNLVKEEEHSIIVEELDIDEPEPTLMVYDDYIEE